MEYDDELERMRRRRQRTGSEGQRGRRSSGQLKEAPKRSVPPREVRRRREAELNIIEFDDWSLQDQKKPDRNIMAGPMGKDPMREENMTKSIMMIMMKFNIMIQNMKRHQRDHQKSVRTSEKRNADLVS